MNSLKRIRRGKEEELMIEEEELERLPVEAKVNMDVVKSKGVSVKRQFQGRFSAGTGQDNKTGRLHCTMKNSTITRGRKDKRAQTVASNCRIEERERR
jgi:hypothetical protein